MDFSILKAKIAEIKKMGWIYVDKNNKGAAGILLENLLCKENHNFEIPDFDGIEVKTRYINSKEHITLFNATPDSYVLEIKRLQETYGKPDKQIPSAKTLNVSITTKKRTYISNDCYFKSFVDWRRKIVILQVYKDNFIVDTYTSWTFEMLREKLLRKLKYLCYVKVDKKIVNGEKFVQFINDYYFKLTSFENFLSLLQNGKIKITFKIGVYRSGKKYGQIYDHGTGFSIAEEDLFLLFKKVQK